MVADDILAVNVTCWEGRPQRTKRPRPPSYWEEYVETDTWYRRKLLEDVPAAEMWAACEDSDVENDVGEDDASDAACDNDDTIVDFIDYIPGDEIPSSEDEDYKDSGDADSGETTGDDESDGSECETAESETL